MTDQLSPVRVARSAGPGSTRWATVVATLTESAPPPRLPPMVTGAEVRADLAGDLDPGPLRRHVTGQLNYTLRSVRYGGRCPDRAEDRWRRLAAAARGYDLVDLEADHDLVPDVLAAVPAHQRRITWCGPATDLAGLRERFDRMARVPAALYLLAPRADSFADALVPLLLLKSLHRTDVTGFGTGQAGTWSRIVAPWLGAPVVYGGAGHGDDAPPVDQLVTDYPFPALPPLSNVYGIVARTLHTTTIVRLVNTTYRQQALPNLFLSFLVPDAASFRTSFLPAVTGTDELDLPVRGLTVAAPYKQDALAAAGAAEPEARTVDGANLLLRRGGHWRAATTDGVAVLAALRAAAAAAGSAAAGAPAGRAAAVIGCGAAGRAAAGALAAAGARVTLVNRGESRGRFAADLLGLPCVPLGAFTPERYAVLVHATPVHTEVPFDVAAVPPDAMIADYVCAARPTALVAAARRRGLTTVDGHAILAQEVAHQFRLMTGRPMPRTNR